jgi:hypothetical protein
MNVDRIRRTLWTAGETFLVPVGLFLAPLVVIVSLQTATYPGTLLGWDSSTYAWWAHLITVQGPLATVTRWNPPSLYPLLLSAIGRLMGDYRLAERILPLLVASPMGYAYFRLTADIASSKRLGYLAAFLGGISPSTLRLVADLHANLMAYSCSLLVGAFLWSQFRNGESALPSRLARLPGLVGWIAALGVVAYTHIWTYSALVVAIGLGTALKRTMKRFVATLLVLAAPLLLPGPFLIGFLLQYPQITYETAVPISGGVVVGEAWLFLGGLMIPFAAVGIASALRRARIGNWASEYVLLWSSALLLLFPVALVMALPVTRLWLLFPMPVFVALSALPLKSSMSSSIEARADVSSTSGRGPRFLRDTGQTVGRAPIAFLVASFLIAAPLMLTSADVPNSFLVPYVDAADVNRLNAIAGLVRDSGFQEPIIVIFGPAAAFYAPIYRAYFGIEAPVNLAYYGKLQFLFTLPPPESVYTWRHDPAVERVLAGEYRAEILAKLGSSSEVPRHPIVVAGGSTYGHPISELFLSRFERMPGLYLIPPGGLNASEIDSWRLFAWSDPHESSPAYNVLASWSTAPELLEWVDVSSSAAFDAGYPFVLARTWSSMRLSIRLWDWGSSYTSANRQITPLAPLEVFLDGRQVYVRQYAGSGVMSISVLVGSLAEGAHRVSFRSGLPGYGVAVRLDTIEIVPVA